MLTWVIDQQLTVFVNLIADLRNSNTSEFDFGTVWDLRVNVWMNLDQIYVFLMEIGPSSFKVRHLPVVFLVIFIGLTGFVQISIDFQKYFRFILQIFNLKNTHKY